MEDATRVGFNLAHFSTTSDGSHQLSGVKEVTETQYIHLKDRFSLFTRIDLRHMYKSTVNNYGKLHALDSFLGNLYQNPIARRNLNSQESAFQYMNSLMNWLNSVRIFVDHELTYYSRRFGKESSQLLAFKKATATQFDNNIAYRFMYKFRNYTTHCGLPLGNVTLGRKYTSNNVEGARESISFNLKKATLLEEFQEWGAVVKKDLISMEDEIEIFPLVRECMVSVHSLMRKVIEIDFLSAKSAAMELKQTLENLDPDHRANSLVRYQSFPDGRVTISPTPIPTNIIDTVIELPDAEGIVEEPNMFEEQSPSFDGLPMLSLETTKYQRRGIEVLSAWIHEGGDTPRFNEVVHEMVREDDNNARPLLLGTILVGHELLQMTSIVTGMSHSELLSNFKDTNNEMLRRHDTDFP
ncbi:hypothetical protein [Glycomyces terrestris]|uniref:Uncharacterized protein n=1 Tax=Glycomyces terrestris TaxID=2493553 RepID=A0A426UZX0_9ACTN|nr:hypothetical protein [Glycomyces terrestris]RRS00181.1 hypothetical protein EIW28_06205 [Glycomyces terrestris]